MKALYLLCLFCFGVSTRKFVDPVAKTSPEHKNGVFYLKNGLQRSYNTFLFDVPLDHFSYINDITFKIRYMVNLDSYKAGGPIFFYTGNEGTITGFIENTGLMWDIAPMFNAALVFAEHRYYGASLPPNAYKNVSTTGFLTSEQALADFAELIYFLKTPTGHQDNSPSFTATTKVIAFGGSYGGMLSAWFRKKYPDVVIGAWASSAPLTNFNGGGVDWGFFDAITTRTYQESGCNIKNIRAGWDAILRLSQTADGQQYLNQAFNIDPKSLIKDINGGYNLYYYVRTALEYMAMTDYPYPSNFLQPMPGWPVKEACKFFSTNTTFSDRTLAGMLFSASQIYYNYKNDPSYKPCIDSAICDDDSLGNLGSGQGWDWQECTEIVIEMCARGNTSFYYDECSPPPLSAMLDYCQSAFTKQRDGTDFGWKKGMLRENGVRNLYGLTLSAASNIILTQGHLDPWSGGGYQKTDPYANPFNGIYIFEIQGSAHHLDLRQPNTCDPNTIMNARYQLVGVLQCWLRNGCKNAFLADLPPLVDNSKGNCTDVINGYPWGQA
ncbi:unnamed protein product, partial [Mesorhabditis belari]|uniref:Uncharacterized protein n=1 Tax=Mesorhabditis belari TaxID=2138241 RepID=A0AAF3EAK9_9BILA